MMNPIELLQAAEAAHQGKQAADAAKAERERTQDETRLRNTVSDVLGATDLPISFRADRWRGQMAYAPLPGRRGYNLHTNQGGALFLGRPCPQCGDELETHVPTLATLGAALQDDSLCTECKYKAEAEAAPVDPPTLVARTFTGEDETILEAARLAAWRFNDFLTTEQLDRTAIKAVRTTQSTQATRTARTDDVEAWCQYTIFVLFQVPASLATKLRGA